MEEQQFCYNIDNFKRDLYRILDLGANEQRVCKKVMAINPHFCKIKKVSLNNNNKGYIHEKNAKGIIYE